MAWLYILLIFVGVIIMTVIVSAVTLGPGFNLRKKFVNLGTLKGKTLNEIEKACGVAISVSYGKEGVKVRTWHRVPYTIVLLFDENEICLGVSSETFITKV